MLSDFPYLTLFSFPLFDTLKSVIHHVQFYLSIFQMFSGLAIHPQQPLQDWNIQHKPVGLPTKCSIELPANNFNFGTCSFWMMQKGLIPIMYTILQNKRIRRCGVPPPPIMFERLKLPQQIIYRRKGNFSESPNHLKYRENILISRFYEHFSRNSRNLGHFWKFEKISNSLGFYMASPY